MSSGAPVEDGTPIRYPSQALLCVDSANTQVFEPIRYAAGVISNPSTAGLRIDDKTPAEIQVNKQAPLMFGYMTRVSLTEVNLDWNTPNVNDRNRYLTIALWYTPDAPVSDPEIIGYARIELVQKFYTLPELTKALQAELNATVTGYPGIAGILGLTWTVKWNFNDFDAPLNNFTCNDYNVHIAVIPNLAPPDARFYFSIVPSNVPRQGITSASPAAVVSIPAIDYDLTKMIGMIPTLDRGTFAELYYTTITSSSTTMQYTPYVDITSAILTKNQNVQDNDSTTRSIRNRLCRLYLAEEGCVARFVSATYATPGDQDSTLLSSFDNAVGTRPFKINKEFKTPKVIQWNTTENIDIIDLEVLDYLGNPIYITPSAYGGGGNELIGNTADFQFTVQVSEV